MQQSAKAKNLSKRRIFRNLHERVRFTCKVQFDSVGKEITVVYRKPLFKEGEQGTHMPQKNTDCHFQCNLEETSHKPHLSYHIPLKKIKRAPYLLN